MGGEHDPLGLGESAHLVERSVNADVGIQVHHRLGVRAGEEVAEEPRLEGRRQLDQAIDHRHPVKLARLEIQILGPHHLKRLVMGIYVAPDVVDDQDRDVPAGMVVEERGRQHARSRKVVAGDDRADTDWHVISLASSRGAWSCHRCEASVCQVVGGCGELRRTTRTGLSRPNG